MKKFTNIIKKKEAKEPNLPFGSDECGKFLKKAYKDSVNESTILNEELY